MNITTSEVVDLVFEAVWEYGRVATYEEAGVLTNDEGVVLQMHDGTKFYITVKKQ